MIIKPATARKLIRASKAIERGLVTHEGRQYMALDHLDLQRTDHYIAADLAAQSLGARGGAAGKGKPKSAEHRAKLAANMAAARAKRWPLSSAKTAAAPGQPSR